MLTPFNFSPSDLANDINGTPTLTASTFISPLGGTMTASQWQIATDSDFNNLVVNTGDVAGASTSYDASGLSPNTNYYWRVRYKNDSNIYSEWSTGTRFTTSLAVSTPTNVSPSDSSTGIGETPELTGSAFASPFGDTMTASQWQVATDDQFTNLVVNTGDRSGTSVAYTIASGQLSVNTSYYWRVRYKTSTGAYSAWSSASSFTTKASFEPVVGDEFGGGYLAGKINQDGTEYYLVISPKASGDTSLAWKTSYTSTSGTSSLIDGIANTTAMNDANHPAAKFCSDLVINGYDDWYLPAKNELEICYYNLKPSITDNRTDSGVNYYSVPARYDSYSSGVPPQTTALAFKTGGIEAFNEAGYWSSTNQYYYGGAAAASNQRFINGFQTVNSKNIMYYVRAVRRVPV